MKPMAAAVQKGNIYDLQFHRKKRPCVGMQVLRTSRPSAEGLAMLTKRIIPCLDVKTTASSRASTF
jgi:imidazoleglycerol phosphate synthase glutamine amidotransferase subunit HisH